MLLRRKLPWASQSQYPVGANPEWVAKGLQFYFNRGCGLVDTASNRPLTTVNSPTTSVNKFGLNSKFVRASSQYIDCGTGSNVDLAGKDFTVFIEYSITSIPVGQSLFSRDNNTGGRSYTIEILDTAGIRAYVNGGGSLGTNMIVEGRTPVIGDTRRIAVVWSPSTNTSQIWADGVLTSSNTAATTTPTATTSARIGSRAYSGFEDFLDGTVSSVAAFGRRLYSSDIIKILANPSQLSAPQERRVFVSVASSGITGTFSVTESVDVPAISGLVNHTGSLAVTESPDITSISGKIVHLGNLSVTESSDTFAASGTVSGSATITGSLALTEISDTASLIGKVAHTGALGVAETADTVSFNGLVAHTGALAVTESADVVAITGGSQITITGSIAITESPDVADFRGPSGNTFSQEVEFRKFYVRKGKKILLFDSVDEAEEYIKAEQVAEEAIAKAKVSSRQERRKIKKRIIKDVLPAESIDTDWLAEMMQRFAINFDLPKLLAEQDYNRVMEIYAMAKAMQDDEDDIEMLLMWG